MSLKFKNTFVDQRKRKLFQSNEIFFECCALLDQSQFSNRMNYYLHLRRNKFTFLTKFRNRCLVSGYNRSVNSDFKVSRHNFLRQVLNGAMPGFYRAVW